ncbi:MULTISPECIES: pro-sigmaK processing inhibitor BofA family protein [Paenibacillus]|uniref:Pro-sigmaK processing inhibitor BofA family protein n=1 Tax=Paenibacillus radicis (ex Xue et al. 2023) TaxID=2972489 RepID=A0ABT1YSH5_9BACL|nr:pro-sigmaK processing inhibitor BofA family protein [Paenibacillus radicis (ex Xue et al. 2023)]MCR8636142.1 pro-sigmaK processing inhibitor BofA family protein [Paenibacillus radicis (ex Xue et al. 2023)]
MIKSYLLWGIFSISGILLVFTLFRHRFAFNWIGYLCLNVAIAAFLLYIVNLLGPYTRVEVPINATTVGTVSVLGVPGLLLLVAVKLWIV